MIEFVEKSTWAATRALWTTPTAEESDWPAKRIIHAGIVRLPEPCRFQRVGVRAVANSYCKCGGLSVRDWPTSIAVHAWRGQAWETVLRHRELPDPGQGSTPDVRWFELDNLESASLLIEARGCSVDKGWTTSRRGYGCIRWAWRRRAVSWLLPAKARRVCAATW